METKELKESIEREKLTKKLIEMGSTPPERLSKSTPPELTGSPEEIADLLKAEGWRFPASVKPKIHVESESTNKNFLCKVGCQTVGRSAQAACLTLSGPAAIVCLAAAEVALDECLDNC